jgi:hypothetical protein
LTLRAKSIFYSKIPEYCIAWLLRNTGITAFVAGVLLQYSLNYGNHYRVEDQYSIAVVASDARACGRVRSHERTLRIGR